MPRLTFLFARLILLALPLMGLQAALQAADDQPPLNEVRIAAVQYEIQGHQTAERSCTAAARRNAVMFAALGDGTRLQLLVRLRTSEPQSIKQLTLGLPITRQAVTKHLQVLENANFVMQQTHGRERRFTARQAAIDEAQAALEVIGQQWNEALVRLKNLVEKT